MPHLNGDDVPGCEFPLADAVNDDRRLLLGALERKQVPLDPKAQGIQQLELPGIG
jgi:hypothetical protein